QSPQGLALCNAAVYSDMRVCPAGSSLCLSPMRFHRSLRRGKYAFITACMRLCRSSGGGALAIFWYQACKPCVAEVALLGRAGEKRLAGTAPRPCGCAVVNAGAVGKGTPGIVGEAMNG